MALLPSALGTQFIASIIAEADISKFLRMGACSYLFEYTPAELAVYEKFEQFIKKYGKIPSKETFEAETGHKLGSATESPKYYRDKLLERHLHRAMVTSSDAASELLLQKDVHKAFDLLKQMVLRAEINAIRPSLYDFRLAHDLVMASINSKLSPVDKDGLDFGWKTFDEMSGGLRGGDLISFIGRPAVGKSFFSLYTALHAWSIQKKVILFVSMEMSPTLIFERLSAMYTHIPANWIKTGGFPTLHNNQKKLFSHKLKKLEKEENAFYVVDGNLSASVDDLVGLCQQLKPDAVFVDGAYLLQIPKFHGSKHEKIGEIARGLKQRIATEFNIPCITSWQFNREATKVKKTEKVGLEHISGSDEIGQLSSMVMGLFQEESAESVYKRKIDILKGREGEVGQILVNWDFNKMDFSEFEETMEMEIL